MESPRKVMAVLDRMDGPNLSVHPERCVLVRNRNASCLRCAEACTSGAIGVDDDGLVIDPDLCIGCGTCATVCPTCALSPKTPDDQALANAAAEVAKRGGGAVVFACSNAVRAAIDAGEMPAGYVEVACLGRVDVTELVELAARGVRRVVLASGGCGNCPHSEGALVRDRTVADARDLLEAFGSPMEIEVEDRARTPEHPAVCEYAKGYSLKRLSRLEETPEEVAEAASDVVARREGFEDGRYCEPKPADGEDEGEGGLAEGLAGGLAGASSDGPGDSSDADTLDELPKLAHVDRGGTLPQFVPPRRTRLFNCLKALGAPRIPTLETSLWGTVTVDADLCDSCRMCAVFCPTGALRRFDGADGAFGVTHQPVFCVQCGTCEAVCPRQAVHVSRDVSLGAFVRGAKTLLPMREPDWHPNRPDSIYTRIAPLLGAQNNLAVY